VTTPVLDVSDPATPTLDGRPLQPGTAVTIRRGRMHPADPFGAAEVDIDGVPIHGIRVVRDGRIVMAVP